MPLRETPYWWDAAEDDGSAPLAVEVPPVRADVAVIGGGLTGLSAARTLARGGASVVVLEKHWIGWGASSRNGGQVLTGGKLGATELIRRFGRERASALHRASLDAIDFVERLVADEGIDCGFRRTGHLAAAAKPSHFVELQREQETLEREFGHRVRLLRRDDQHSEIGSDRYHGLLLDEKSGALDPTRYVRGLGRAAARAGAVLAEDVQVLRLQREAAAFRVDTSRGPVVARDVLVATNGYTDGALPSLRRRVVPVGSYVVATAPLSESGAAALLPRGRVVFDTKNFLYYFRLSADRRLLFGGRARFTPATEGSTRAAAAILRRGITEVFPALGAVDIEYAWSGNVCFATDRLPHAGRLNGVHYAMGYAGHGVAMASFLGDVMGDLLLGRPDRNPYSERLLRPIPLYEGRPWFLPLVGLWYKVRDFLL
jgi:glycine/D-amino acid oxidase-like deaminating enzyme